MWLVYGLGLGAEKPQRIYRSWEKITKEEFKELDYESYFGLDFGTSKPTACMEVKYDGDAAFYIREAFYKPLQDIDKSLANIFKTKIKNYKKGESLVVADSAKQSYIDLLAEVGHMIVGATKGAGSVETGISIIQKLKIYYVPSPGLSEEYESYSWTIDRYEQPTDVPVKKDDHLMDALRYIIMYLREYLDIRT
jgi:phage terminase large subunit